jgi:hypothetical protein
LSAFLFSVLRFLTLFFTRAMHPPKRNGPPL